MKVLVTGATGCIGSFLAEELVMRGMEVRALVRKTSNLSEIKHLKLDFHYGDVTDAGSVRAAVSGVDYVFHTAARMNDWGPWEIFHAQNIAGTRNLLEASSAEGIKRFIHTSSTGVTGLGALMNTTEDAPCIAEGNYELSKVEAERLVVSFCTDSRLPYTIIRPCWTLGPRARRHIPLLIEYLRSGKFKVLGNGRCILNFVDPRDVAQAMYLAAVNSSAASQTYHITNDCHTSTQEDLYKIVAAELNCRPPSLHVPFTLALAVSWVMERWATWRDWDDAPMLTPVRVKFLGRNRDFSCEKAKRDLEYKPRFSLQQSLADAVCWYNHLSAYQRSLIPELQLA